MVKNKYLQSILIADNASIKEVMRVIDNSGMRVAYIVDTKGKLVGVVSDSEIRRAILAGKDIKQSVKDVINTKPIVIKDRELGNEIKLRQKISKLKGKMPDNRYILVLDKENKPVDMLPTGRVIKKTKTIEENIGADKCVLVVGGAGYLGSVLVRQLLNEGYRVKVLDLLLYGSYPIESLLPNNHFEFIEGDMRNISTLVKALEGADAVVNLAAIVGDPACKNKPETAIETNFLANKALTEACKYNQVNRFIYASTCSVYGAMTGDKHLTEDSPLNPVSLYARSKIQSEEGILSLEDENFSPTILRMSTLYGYSPRMRFDLVVNTMTKTAVVDGKIYVHGGGKQWRPLLNTEDAALAYLNCIRAPLTAIKGEIFNVGSSQQNYQIIDIAKQVQEVVPAAELVSDGESTDSRNYIVSFERIENKLAYKAQQKLAASIKKIKSAIENKEFNDVNDSKYYNVEIG